MGRELMLPSAVTFMLTIILPKRKECFPSIIIITNFRPNTMSTPYKKLNIAFESSDNKGYADLEKSWASGPNPMPAGPHHLSTIRWARAMGKEEARSQIGLFELVSMSSAPGQGLAYFNSKERNIATIRAYQVLKKEKDIPKELLAPFEGKIPSIRSLHFYSLTQIYRSGKACMRAATHLEMTTGEPIDLLLHDVHEHPHDMNGYSLPLSEEDHKALQHPTFMTQDAADAYMDRHYAIMGPGKPPSGAFIEAAAAAAAKRFNTAAATAPVTNGPEENETATPKRGGDELAAPNAKRPLFNPPDGADDRKMSAKEGNAKLADNELVEAIEMLGSNVSPATIKATKEAINKKYGIE